MPDEISAYLLLGSAAGLLAGLLGVGGGLIIVPVLAALFIAQGIDSQIIMHLALGTSLASILITSISSVISHHKKRAVVWTHVFKLSLGILLGAWCGGLIAGQLSSEFLKPVFAVFELLVAAYMLYGYKPTSQQKTPSLLNFNISGSVIGFISSIVGIGGGTMSVPWLMWHGSSIHKAIATSAAIGFPIALSGSFSYLYSGWQHANLPEHSIGFIYLPALLGIVISSVIFAPLGASLAHRLDVQKLKKIFAYLLIALAIHLLNS
jgi:uncharacterized protein